MADRVRDYGAGVVGVKDLGAVFAELEARARGEMRGARLARFADLRYRGQSYELTVPWRARGAPSTS